MKSDNEFSGNKLRKMKSYSDIVAGLKNNKKFKITVRSKVNYTPESIKELIKKQHKLK
jgi:predicted CopG family antitoxin